MSDYSITVDTGGGSSRDIGDASLAAFWRNAALTRNALEGMKVGVRSLRSGIQGAARSFARMGGCVRGVLSALMNTRNVVQGLQAGMRNLDRYSRTWWKRFAGTLSALASNALYLRNSLAAMATPLLNALSPAIDLVTDKFVGLFNLINQFFARLTGASTYVAARKASGSLNAVGGAASNAAEEVRELKRQLADFDELNVLSAPDSGSGSGSGSGGGSGGGGAGVMFEEREIENGLAAFVDSLKAAFLASDWQTLGTLLGDRFNELVDSVDWAGLGSRFGFYLNGAIQTAYYLLDTVNFRNIGARVAELLNNALAEIDFSTVGATVALLFTSLAETVAGFVEEFDWVQFAEKLADGLNGFVTKLGEKLDAVDWAGLALRLTEGLNAFIARTDWASVGSTLAGRINDLLAILGTAAANFDWKAAGSALATAVNNLFKGVDWDALGDWLNDTLQGVLDFGIAFFQGFDAKGFADNVSRALDRVDWDAVSEKLWTLFKAALQKLGEFFGTLLFGGSADVKLNLALLKSGWETLAGWLGIDKPLQALIGLLRNGWTSIAAFIGTAVSVATTLTRNGWKSIGDYVGTAVSVATTLTKNGWKSIGDYVGTAVTVAASLTKAKGTTENVGALFGTALTAAAKLVKANGTTKSVGDLFGTTLTAAAKLVKAKGTSTNVGKLFGTALTAAAKLVKAKGTSTNVGKLFGTALTAAASLVKAKNTTKTVGALFGSSISVSASLDSASAKRLRAAATKAMKGIQVTVKAKSDSGGAKMETQQKGGAITAGGRKIAFAGGGIIRGGLARYLENVPHYAGGTSRAHGTVFVAGEAGPEIMGHINGRTEILNRSQLAQTMYAAVVAGMSQAAGALGTFLSGQLAACTNAITATIGMAAGRLSGLSAAAGLRYHAPAMASGSVLPYEVAARVERSSADIRNTLDANNEDLIQTIISVIGAQTSAIVAALRASQQGGGAPGGLTAQQLINDINRRTQMFGGSPLLS